MGVAHAAFLIVPAVFVFSVVLAVGIGRVVVRGIVRLMWQQTPEPQGQKKRLSWDAIRRVGFFHR